MSLLRSAKRATGTAPASRWSRTSHHRCSADLGGGYRLKFLPVLRSLSRSRSPPARNGKQCFRRRYLPAARAWLTPRAAGTVLPPRSAQVSPSASGCGRALLHKVLRVTRVPRATGRSQARLRQDGCRVAPVRCQSPIILGWQRTHSSIHTAL